MRYPPEMVHILSPDRTKRRHTWCLLLADGTFCKAYSSPDRCDAHTYAQRWNRFAPDWRNLQCVAVVKVTRR